MSKLKERVSANSFVYISAIVSFLILTFVVFLFPIEFSEYRNTDRLAPIWFLITETGGFYGGIVILIVLIAYLLIHCKKFSKKYLDFYVFMMIILFAQFLTTAVTQYYGKEVFHFPRPTQLYFIEKGFVENEGKDFLNLSIEEKRNYLEKKLNDSSIEIKEIYPPILKSWIDDSGFSFPSGHSQTSFFLGTIIAFVIYKTINEKRKYYSVVPLIWAILVGISRVVIGVHYPLDVTAGAFIGMSAAFIVISLKKINSIFD